MKEETYEILRQRLDQLFVGVPKSAKGTEIKLLKELFTPEEAQMASQLRSTLESGNDIANRLGRAKEEIEPCLKSMAHKGLIFSCEEGGTRYYTLVPLMPGIFEYFLIDFEPTEKNRRMAGLIEEYYSEVLIQDLHMKGISPWARTLVVEKQILHEVGVLPYERASEIVKNAPVIALLDCYCRGQQRLIGKGCEAPHEDICLIFGPFADFELERGHGKKIPYEEGLKVLQRAEEAGLVHCCDNIQEPTFICNCCGCCCGILRGITQMKNPTAVARSNFCLSIDQESCSGCGACVERCQVKALKVEDTVVEVDASLCIGCGLCNLVCPTESLSMKRKEEPATPFETYDQLMLKIMQEKGKPLSL